MRRLVPALLLCALAAAQDPSPAERARVEFTARAGTFFVGERVAMEVRVAFDAAFFRDHGVQTARHRLSVPVQVSIPTLADLPGLTFEPAESPRATFALNGQLVEGRRLDDEETSGRPFLVVSLRLSFVPDRAGLVRLGPPELRFTFATRFEEDLVRDRVPVDPREVVVRGRDLDLPVENLPLDGRPPTFTGAVGTFAIRAEADQREVAPGGTLRVRVIVSGDGDLRTFLPPRLDSPLVRTLGVLDQLGHNSRTLTYDVQPLGSATEIPAIPFSFFETAPRARYRTIRTAPIPIVVRAPGTGAETRDVAPEEPPRIDPALVPGHNDIVGLKAANRTRAELAYRKGRYGEARDLFAAAAAESPADAALHYDAGNAAFRMGRPAEAMLHFGRARIRAPRDADIAFNLDLAARHAGVLPRSPRLIERWTKGEVAAVLALAALAGLLIGIGSRSRARRFAGGALAAVALACAVFGLRSWPPGPREAIVLAPEAAVRADPHGTAAVTATIKAGATVIARQASDHWVLVASGNAEGWVERDAVGIIE